MTASEAREAARWHAEQAGDPPSDEAYAMHRRAAVALSAYADGIDAPEFRPTSSDTNRLHRIRARLLALVPLDGTMSLADDVQRLDRALADAEARGRQHGAAAVVLMLDAIADECIEDATAALVAGDARAGNAKTGAMRMVIELSGVVQALAKEATDGR